MPPFRLGGRAVLRDVSLALAGGEVVVVGDRSTQVTVGDASGGRDVLIRFQRLTITPALASELAAIGDGPFDATVSAVEDDPNPNDDLHAGFEPWPRGADDVQGP